MKKSIAKEKDEFLKQLIQSSMNNLQDRRNKIKQAIYDLERSIHINKKRIALNNSIISFNEKESVKSLTNSIICSAALELARNEVSKGYKEIKEGKRNLKILNSAKTYLSNQIFETNQKMNYFFPYKEKS